MEATPGAQLVARVAAVMEAVSAESDRGIRTIDVAAAAGLSRPTAHRLLNSLQRVGYIDRDESLGLWTLGPEVYVLGMIAARRYEVTTRARRSVIELAKATGESAFFSIRRAEEVVCLLREEGSFPLRSFVLSEGSRFPLGVSSGGIAILAYRTEDEVQEYLERVDLAQRWGPQHSTQRVLERVERTRELGYSLNPGLIVEGSFGMAAAIFSRSGTPEWALSITGVESRFKPDRRAELGAILLDLAHDLSRQAAPGN
jgi:DNA-binding IclR family transcriptional regulator